MKKLLVAGVALIALLVVGAGIVWYYMGKPMYEPGMVARDTGKLAPPIQTTTQVEDWVMGEGVTLHHFEQGSGRSVLMLHGGPGKPFRAPLSALEPLANRYRFIYYDQRGSGRSARPINRFSTFNFYENLQVLEKTLGLSAQLSDIERIRRILGEQKLIVFGHSFGAFQAALYAAEFPENVEALVLVAPASTLVMPSPNGDLFTAVAGLLPEGLRNEHAGFLKTYLDYGDIFSKSDADLVTLNASFDKYYRAAANVKNFSVPANGGATEDGGWMVQAQYFSMGRRHDYRSALKNVKVPVLILHGENDIQPESVSREYATAFPNARVQVIGNSGHFIFLDAPDTFANAVGGFLDRAIGGRRLSGLKSQ